MQIKWNIGVVGEQALPAEQKMRYLQTNCVGQGHSSEVNSSSANQETPQILWNLKFVTKFTSPCFETKSLISLPPIQIL